ncbi:putative ABC transporter permease/ATP-binding protein [Rubrivivax gelatinosus IL144]|uniref:Putative ABC transporter permease/ATP-binding protein n=2 Tax=Rubrivivax gelatinosus TaxID=28068 RepID=I0HNM2_RUBGI|nr:putative ABC transporter permease/ATP-binding protein [Rubrivivax gelatinosus IL144]
MPQMYRHLWRHAQGVRARLGAALAMQTGAQLLKLALPWLAAKAIDTLQTRGAAGLADAGLWILAIVATSLALWALHGPARVLERSVAVRVRASVADGMYTQLVHAPLAWHERHHSGDLQHRVAMTGTALYDFTQSQFIYLQNVINVAGPLVALALLSRQTGALALAGFVAIGTVILRFDRALMRLAADENLAERRYVARLLDFVGNISAVASLRLQEATRTMLASRLAAVFVPLRRSIVLTEWKWCAVDLLGLGLSWGLVVAYALSTASGAGGPLLIGSLFMVYQYAQQASGVMGSIAANYQNLARMRTHFASGELIREAPPPRAEGAAPDARWQAIELHGLVFRHAGASRGGLHGVSLALRRGERVALVGPSGSGKSTLLRVLAGLYDAQGGRISIDGVVEPGRRHLAELSTLIPQEAEIFEATMLENITLERAAPDTALAQAVHASALDEVLQTLPLGLATPMSERGFNLSGGQRQRLALARGVLAARDSSLLLLDEPTSALDALTEQRVHQRLAAAFPGACIVSAVHRMSLLAHFDRVVFMVGGGVVDVGRVDELQARQPLFAAMLLGSGHEPAATAAA